MKTMMTGPLLAAALLVGANDNFISSAAAAGADTDTVEQAVQLGPRPYYLLNDMDAGPLKTRLEACKSGPFKSSAFSIGHRGAPLQFPEHTRESYVAAARMGAGIVECDVTFTRDLALVCRHAQNDLHTTTNILATPLAQKCTQPFVPADPATDTEARAECRTSDITLAEFRSLRGKMDSFNPRATTVEAYMDGTAAWRTDLYATDGTLMTHQESIALLKDLGVKYTPELKAPVVAMPFKVPGQEAYSQTAYAGQMIQEYVDAGVAPAAVWPQSFDLQDVLYWLKEAPDFGKQAVFLDEAEHSTENQSLAYMEGLAGQGVTILAPALWKMLTLNDQQAIVPSEYARNAKTAGLDLIAWSVERSGPLADGGGWYHQSISEAIDNDGDLFTVIDVLAQDVGVIGIFSDWPATTTYYANCVGL